MSKQKSNLQLDRIITDYMGKRMSYQVAIDLLIAVQPDIAELSELEQKSLVDHEYAPGRLMSYRYQDGNCTPYGYVDIPDTPQSAARQNLEKLIEALPQSDWLFHIGGGGGAPMELVDPEVLIGFINVVRDVAERYMEPILVALAVQKISQYVENRLDSKHIEQEAENQALRNRVENLEARLLLDVAETGNEEQQVGDSEELINYSANTQETTKEIKA